MKSSSQDMTIKKTNKTGSCVEREVYVARKVASPEDVLLRTAWICL